MQVTIQAQTAREEKKLNLSDKAIGLLIVAFLPALFWGSLYYLSANLLGFEASLMTFATISSLIAVFLSTLFAAFWK